MSNKLPNILAKLLTAIIILSIFTAATPASALPTEVWVDDDYDSGTTGWGTTHWDTIEDGITAVADGGTVHVAAGTYQGTVEVKIDKSNIHIISSEFESTGIVTLDKTLIVAPNQPNEKNEKNGVKIEKDGVTFEGFTITGAGAGAGKGIGLKIETGMGVIISNNIITGFEHGIKVETNAEVLISHNTITGNEYGILVETSNDVEISDNTITANEYGIRVQTSGEVLISHNTITANEHGILVQTPDVTANLNNIYGNTVGIETAGGITIDATMNWWDTSSQSEITALVSERVNFNPWLPADFETSLSDTDGDGLPYYEEIALGTDPDDSSDSPGASIENYQLQDVTIGGGTLDATKDTGITVDYEANDETTITVATYVENPKIEPSFSDLDNYIDVRVDEPEKLDSVTIKLYYEDLDPVEPSRIEGTYENNLRMYYWYESKWTQCSNTGVNMEENYIWAILDKTTTPDLSYLSGGEFGTGDINMELDKEFYHFNDEVSIILYDSSANLDSLSKDKIEIIATSSTNTIGIIVELTETETNTGRFEGTPRLTTIEVNVEDTIYINYYGSIKTATIINYNPVANAGKNKESYVGNTINFNGAKSYDLDGRIVRYKWYFGDGDYASGKQVSHTYSEPGSYTVTLYVKDNNGDKEFDKCIVTIYSQDTGTLSIDTEPVKGEVFVNGLTWGTAPQSQKIIAGNYTISYGDIENYTTPNDKKIEVTAQTTTEILGTYVLTPIIDIYLSTGWNLISLPVIPHDPTIETVLADILDNVNSVWSYDAGTWTSFKPNAPSVLTEIVDGKSYWIDMSKASILAVNEATEPTTPFQLPPQYTVTEGWNLIGFTETNEMKVEDYLKGVNYIRVYEYTNRYNQLKPTDYMTPGHGYWIATNAPGTIYT